MCAILVAGLLFTALDFSGDVNRSDSAIWKKAPIDGMFYDGSERVNESSIPVFEEPFLGYSLIDKDKSTAIVEGGKATLSGSPIPDVDSDVIIPLDWLPDPVHDYSFHPNAMTYDTQSNALVLSMQGTGELHLVNKDSGDLIDEIQLDIDTDNNTGIGYGNGGYYYSVGGGSDSTIDLYRYDKATEKSIAFGVNTSNKDGFPLVVLENSIIRGRTYQDGKQNWGTINILEKIPLANPDEIDTTHMLDFNGVQDLAYDGNYIWVLKDTNDVSLSLYSKNGVLVDDFPDLNPVFSLDDGFKARGLAYAGNYLYILVYEDVEDQGESSFLLRLSFGKRYYDSGSVISKTFYQSSNPVASVKIEADVQQPSSTNIEYYVGSGNAGDWKKISSDDWTGIGSAYTKLKYKLELSSTNSDKTPIVTNIKISCNSVNKPEIITPDNNIWTGGKPDMRWNFNDKNDQDNQTAFNILISNVSTFDSVLKDINEEKREGGYKYPQKMKGGAYYWKVRTKDELMGWSPFSDVAVFNVDVDSPGGLVRINDENKSTTDSFVNLEILVSDSSTNVTEVHISEEERSSAPEFYWQHYEKDVNFTVSEELGEKIIYVWFKDEAGNVGGPASAVIQLKKASDDDEEGALGMGKIGKIDVLYLLIAGLILLLILIILIKTSGSGHDPYYDDDEDEEYEEYGEEKGSMSSLEAIRRKHLEQVQFDSRYNEDEVEEGFLVTPNKYGGSGGYEQSPYSNVYGGYGGSGRYGSSPYDDDELSLEYSSYSAPPSLDDFINKLEGGLDREAQKPSGDSSKEEPPEEMDDEKRYEKKVEKIKEQIAILKERESGLKEKIEKTSNNDKEEELKKNLGDIEKLRRDLENYLEEGSKPNDNLPPPPP